MIELSAYFRLLALIVTSISLSRVVGISTVSSSPSNTLHRPEDEMPMTATFNLSNLILGDPIRRHPPHAVEFPIHEANPRHNIQKAWMTFVRSQDASHDLMAYDILIPLAGTMSRCYLRRMNPQPNYPYVGHVGYKYDTNEILYELKEDDTKRPTWLTWQMIWQVTNRLIEYTHEYAALDTIIELWQADETIEEGKTVMARGALRNIGKK